jgi:nucleolar GTP-binding protein
MQAITALAHLNACILFLLDISETCGYKIEEQISLFNSIKPLFQAKPLVIVLTKIDETQFGKLDKSSQAAIQGMAKENNSFLI